jgi:hypothetical protein
MTFGDSTRRDTLAFGIAILAGCAGIPAAAYAADGPSADAQARAAWGAAIAQTPRPQEGCFKASYPSTDWRAVACKVAPTRPYLPRNGHGGFTVGDGNDYLAVAPSLVSSAKGAFPVVTGVKKEVGYGNTVNTYSIQLNSEFFTSPVCKGAATPSSCLGWQQFVYSNSGVAFMQYWLINYGSSCPPGGWMAYSGDCYRNSAGVSVPTQVITQLGSLVLTGSAVKGGIDTFVMTTAADAYSTTGKDSVVDLAGAWKAAEFNVVGDGGGSAARFNKGASLTVSIAFKDGNATAPACRSDQGTTGETNNLTLGACSVAGGTSPAMSFTEAR